MSEAFLKADNLHKSFNERKAVNGISFTIYQGEIFGLLGPNGAGKTTTIRILSTVLEPDRGDVTIGGHSIRRDADADAVRRLIGVCPQENVLRVQIKGKRGHTPLPIRPNGIHVNQLNNARNAQKIIES